MFSIVTLFVSAWLSAAVLAAPPPLLRARQANVVTQLSAVEVSSLVPLAQFARAAYCPPDKIKDWNCGAACRALPSFEATLQGGDGNAVQFFYVGFDSDQNAVVVAHQGTDPLALESVLTDLNILKDALDPNLFPGVPKEAWIHTGFRDAHAETANQILNEVSRLFVERNTNTVITVGHSLGGALAELDTLFLKLNLPAGSVVKSVTFGTPRVGNDAFVSFFESQGLDFKRVNNGNDLIPIIPGQFLGFQHPKSEVRFADAGALACPGSESEDEQCQAGAVPTIFQGNIIDHLGPYEGVFIGTLFCND